MNQEGYVFLYVFVSILLVAVLFLTYLDIIQTRRQRTLAKRLIKRATDEYIKAEEAGTPEKSDVSEMQILHDIVLEDEKLSKGERSARRRLLA